MTSMMMMMTKMMTPGPGHNDVVDDDVDDDDDDNDENEDDVVLGAYLSRFFDGDTGSGSHEAGDLKSLRGHCTVVWNKQE